MLGTILLETPLSDTLPLALKLQISLKSECLCLARLVRFVGKCFSTCFETPRFCKTFSHLLWRPRRPCLTRIHWLWSSKCHWWVRICKTLPDKRASRSNDKTGTFLYRSWEPKWSQNQWNIMSKTQLHLWSGVSSICCRKLMQFGLNFDCRTLKNECFE